MSADNGIYILCTLRHSGEFGAQEVYRVACVSAIENFDWYQQNEPQNFDAYVSSIWQDEPWYTKQSALIIAADMEEEHRTEYGIRLLRANDPLYIHPFDRL